MQVLVIGANGYIGSKLVEVLATNKLQVFTMDCEDDITFINFKGYYQDFDKSLFKNFDTIVLLAGQGSVSNSSDLMTVVDNNIRNFGWLLNILSKEQKFIYASSSSAYGNTMSKEVDETFTNFVPYNYYDWSKNVIDQLASLSDKQFYSLRFGTVNGYSPNLRNDLMINSMVFNAKKDGKIFVSNGDIYRPILGINDLCKGICAIIQSSQPAPGIYNMNSFNMTVKEIADNVSKTLQIPVHNNFTNKIVNYKTDTKMYNFKIHSKKFSKQFNFEFKDTIDSIVTDLVSNWESVKKFENRLQNKYIDYITIDKCRVCDNSMTDLLNLGEQPLANNYLDSISDICKKYPLNIQYCKHCFHVQLDSVVNPEKLFNNYVYVSGTSLTLKDYFSKFATHTIERYLEHSNGNPIKILDIACNDGSQLDAFKNILGNDCVTVGVDPAKNIYSEFTSKKLQHHIYCNFFNQDITDNLLKTFYKFDIIVAQNVFAHVNNPSEFLNCCRQLLSDSGTLYIQTSQKDMILQNQFDTCYHEHLNFFNSNSMNLLCKKNKLFLNNVFEHLIHGNSYIFVINNNYTPDDYNLDAVLEIEKENGLLSVDTYNRYAFLCQKYKHDLCNQILNYKLSNKFLVAYGSTAKSMTVFNYCGITRNDFLYMIDDNPLKKDKFTPGSMLEVKSIDVLSDILKTINSTDIVIYITAWNFYDEVKEKVTQYLGECAKGITFVDLNTLDALIH
jgi:nucleoside-diphosphate-sugar epimerase/ubiquinone/menaquinone biosynthesis C-methylase UbiE